MDTEIEAMIRREVQKQLHDAVMSMKQGKTPDYTADEYDWKGEPVNVYPGKGWIFTAVGSVGIHMIILWRKRRADVANDGQKVAQPMV
jgi:hypothetical protein